MGRLFGTDGIRGVANSELSPELAMKIGQAAATVLKSKEKSRLRVLIGKDTRISGDMLENAIASGLCSVGADVMLLGVVSTPAVAYLVKKYGYDAAFMISASHNPYEYNGIKIFDSEGYKLPDETEEKIEAIILDETDMAKAETGFEIGRITLCKSSAEDYINHLRSSVDTGFSDMDIALDCANGSASVSAKELFESLGARCHVIYSKPDGVNINNNCGSTHLENLQNYVKENSLTVGVAFDGDADRMLAVDENGEIVDGDKIIAVCTKYLKDNNKLKNNTVVVTVMTNMGFYKFCDKENINYETTKVGDRYVLQKMLKEDYIIGGEQSGHIIFKEFATTGDGQLTALQLLSVMKKTGKKLSELSDIMSVYPQTMINVRVSHMGKARFNDDEEIRNAIVQAEKQLGDKGRVLVRVSGTEPLVRVMLEGEDKDTIETLAKEIANVVENRLI